MTYQRSYEEDSTEAVIGTAESFNDFLSQIDDRLLNEYEWEAHKVNSTVHSSVYTETDAIDKITE